MHKPGCRAETAVVQAVDHAVGATTAADIRPERCFAAGTLVHTAKGLVPIEQVRVGDRVLSKHDSGEGEQAYKRVLRTVKSAEKAPIIYVEYYSERNMLPGSLVPQEALQGLFVTESHPFYIEDVGWKPAIAVLGPRKLVVFDNTPVKAAVPYTLWATPEEDVAVGLSTEYDHGPVVDFRSGTAQVFDLFGDARLQGGTSRLFSQTVYDLEVEDFHTYYVGELGVWVHNVSDGGSTCSPGETSGSPPECRESGCRGHHQRKVLRNFF